MSKLGDKRRAELSSMINNSFGGGTDIGNQRREEMYDIVNHSNGHTDLGNRRRAELLSLTTQWGLEAMERDAKNSPIAFNESGKVSPGQTILNFKSYIDGFKQHRKENEEYEHQKQRERNAYLANWEKHGGKTFELFGKTYGIGKVDDDFLEEQKKIDEAFKRQRKSEKIPGTAALPSPSDVGMPSPDNIRRTAESAQHLAKHYGVGTAQIVGSDTRRNIEAYQKEYSDMNFGEKLAENPKLTAGNYALDLISAGLTAADALTGGKLGRGELGKASSIFNIADFLQSGSSELVGISYGTMRESTNWLGKLVLDLERTGIEQIMDRAIGRGNGLIPMGIRVFGAGAQEAQSEGRGIAGQVGTGLIRSGIEVGTEMLGGVGGSWRGTGYGDAVFSALDKWIAGKTGSELLGTMASAFGSEGLEEMISDVLNPLADRIFNLSNGDASYWEEVWGDGQILYDGLLGGLAGLGGGAVTHLGTTAQAKSLGIDVATYKAAQRIVENNSLKKKFENYSGVELSEDNSDAIVETAIILTDYSSDEVSSRDIEQEVRNGAESRAEFAGNGALDATIQRMGLSDEGANIIREGFPLGKAEEIIYAKGIEEAYEYGKAGVSESAMLKRGSFVGELTQIQRTHAYEMGKMATANKLKLEKYAKKFGPQAESVKAAYVEGQNVSKYIQAYGSAYNMGKAYMGESALSDPAISYLNEDQKELAYRNGRIDADNAAAKLQAAIVPNGKTGHKPGKVTAQGISVKELSQTFNDPQRKAFNILRGISAATGINIVLYKSEAGESGRFTDAQGKFKRNEDTIYIDANAGLYYTKDVSELSKYTMLRTFSHELTHFIEKWSPEKYNELRETVFEELNKRGENANDLIEGKMAKSKGMSYDAASREVVAEAMTDILPDSSFIENLAAEHKTLFEKIREKLREFASEIKAYFDKLVKNPAREANALKEQVGEGYHYIESVVKAFDAAAAGAVKNYQGANDTKSVKSERKKAKMPVSKAEKTESNEKKAPEITDKVEETQDNAQNTPEITDKAEKIQDNTQDAAKITGDDFTITRNEEHNGIEIAFPGKPSEAVRDVLKANKFRWHKKKKIWYGRGDAETIAEQIRAADNTEEPENAAESVEAPVTKPVTLESIVDRIQEPSFNADSIKDVRSMVKLISQSAEATKAILDSNLSVENFINHVKETDSFINGKKLVPVKEAQVNENADNSETVQQPDGDRQGNARLLDEPETGNVSGNAQERNSVGSPSEGERQTVRNGRGSDSRPVTPGTGSGNGDSESRVSGSVELKAEVENQIERESTEKPRGQNFVIGDSLDLPSGDKSKFKANVEAIRLLKQLETEDRYATAEEQKILSKYVGWGGLANAFDERKSDWAKEYSELKELLTKEEYEAARASILNAHYTDIQVIKAMYEGLEQLGFKGGRMLEPASGVGNFVGAMPESMSAKVKSWTMVELDSITGRIAHYLYPYADVRVQGFEKANIPDNFMDVAISNVPFGNFPITDKKYPKRVTSAIHNYFFAKALDKVRPGGIVMFITSRFTMDGKDTAVRKYISERADLLGAIRLPDTAFKGNAGTPVVADILILKKRASGTEYAGEDFQNVNYIYDSGIYTQINTYFRDHPHMVLGQMQAGGRYGEATYKAYTDRGTLGEQVKAALQNIKGQMDYPKAQSTEKINKAVERAEKKTKNNAYVSRDGKIYRNENGGLVEQELNSKQAERVNGMLGIRDALRELYNALQQGLSEEIVKKARKTLNDRYNKFVKSNGFLNSAANRAAFKSDPDSFSLLALENWDAETKKATKADIFEKNTIAPIVTITSAKDVSEGLIVSRNRTGGVDVPLIAKLTGESEEAVTRELLDSRLAFKNSEGVLEPSETYLSGNVRAKLRDAEAMVPFDADYKINVEALKEIVPEDIKYQDIYINPGTPWIPSSVYSEFASHILGGNAEDTVVKRNPETGNFTVDIKNFWLKNNAANTQKWGTKSRSFLDLYNALLNSKSVVIRYKDEDGKSIVDKDATAAANEKIEKIKEEFQEWVWKDEVRKEELTKLYNETFNAIVTPKYNGDHLTVKGANAMKPLRPHQRDAVQRIVSSGGNTLLAHKVGAGKTYEMAAAAMKLKELGLVKKPMFAVPKSLVAQWGKEFKDFFPTAKLLVAENSDFTPANRKIYMNRIANGEYDAVIVSYEQFEKLPVSDEFTMELYQEQIDEVIAAIEEAKAEGGDSRSLSVKDLEKKRKSLEAKIEKLTSKPKDEDNISFEQLGVDALFVDEAHNFKNLFYTTSMSNVAGLGNKDGSQRAFDLFTKVRYLQQLNGGKGIVFATATPVMNSMSEMYIMQKYLQPDTLKQLGIYNFDAWAKQFGEVVNGVEIKPSGQGFRVKQSFSKFKNLPELQMLFRNFADVLTDIPGLKIPKMKGGKVNIVQCEPSEFQKEYMEELEKRAENIKNVDPSVDNMLKITSDGKKVSYTQRMIDPSLPYEEDNKIFKCADNILKLYKRSGKIKGTQLVFLDAGVPKGKTKAGEEMNLDKAELYEDLKARLVKGGIPAKEIDFIHSADTDAKKKKLFADVNEGRIRVLIGSTGKMGVGMNAQRRVVAIHHLDAPYRPGDIEQRDGRAFRQGNINDEVEKFVYVTEGTFDTRLWDILDRKQSFINQVMNGDSVGRDAEDTGEVTLSAAEVKALASGNPLIMEQVQLDTDLKRLESLKRAYNSEAREANIRLQEDKTTISRLEKRIAAGEQDVKDRQDNYQEDKFSIQIGKKSYTDKKEAGAELLLEIENKATEDGYTDIGRFAGFTIKAVKGSLGYKGLLYGKRGYPFNIYTNAPTRGITHLMSVVADMSNELAADKKLLEATKADLKEQIELSQKPFDKQAELDKTRKRFNEVMEILNPREEQSMGELEEQEESREYLKDVPKFSYEWFENKPDIEIVNVTEEKQFDRAELVQEAKRNAASVGKLNENGVPVVHVNDIDTDVLVSKKSLVHGLDRRLSAQAPVLSKIGEVLKGAVLINELNPRSAEASKTYILAAVAESKIGKYVTTFVVNKFTNEVAEINVLYSANTKKEPAAFPPKLTDYKPATPTGSKIRITELLDLVNKHFPDVLPEAVLKHYGYDSRPEGKLGGDVLYQARTKSFTDRDILWLAAKDMKVEDFTEAEVNALDIFMNRLEKLEQLQVQRHDMGKLYNEQQFHGKGTREEAKKTLNRMHILDEQIKKASDAVLKVEESEVLRRVLKESRKLVEKQERDKGQERLRRYRDQRANFQEIKKYREEIQRDVNELSKWVLHPSNKNVLKHIPEAIKQTVIPFLMSINFSSKQSLRGGRQTKADMVFMDKLFALKTALKENQDTRGMYSGYNDLPTYFMERLDDFIANAQRMISYSDVEPDEAGEYVINNMSADELHDLASMIKNLKQLIINMNKFHMNGVYKHVYDAGDESIEFMSKLDSKKRSGGLSNFLMWRQIRPAYAFARFGEGGKAIFDELRKGQSTLAHNTKTIADFAEKTYTAEEVRAWEKETKTFNINGEAVEIPIANIMSLYCLRKRPAALTHIYGSGVRVATWSDKDGRHSDNREAHGLTTSELYQITESLTPRQKMVAELLQGFMAKQGGEWGNYVSVARFGEELFGEKEYFPINSDGRHLPADADEKPEGTSLYALLNMSFTKELKKDASNRIVLYSIFDVFANHMASMAQYNALALPVVDALKWFNYRQVDFDDRGNKIYGKTVRDEMARAFGAPDEDTPGKGRNGYAEKFVIGILKSFNGTEAQGTPTDTIGVNALHRYNMAQVAFNFRVVVQQPLAITRAAMLVSYKSIMQGLRMSPEKIKANIEEMQKYSGIARWKSLGFNDVNISRGLTAVIKHDKSPLEKIGDVGMWGAEHADTITWAAMWNACKAEVDRKGNNKQGTEQYFKEVTDLFEDVIYKTQVVDSVLTKNEFLRSKGFFARAIGSFMSEPTTTASMLLDAYDKYSMDLQRGYNKSQAWKRNGKNITRTVYVYSIGALMLAAAQAVADAWRDDDDYMTFAEKWLDAFKGNLIDELMPLNKLPFFNDIYEVFKSLLNAMGVDTYGNEPRSLWMQWRKSLIQGFEIIHKRIIGDTTSGYTWYGGAYKLLQAASGITGLPMAAVTREIVTAWNNTAGAISPKLKIKSYEPSEMSQVKYAYQDGYLTEEEATKELLDKKLAKNKDAAYWIINGWNTGGNKYDRLYNDILEGKSTKEPIAELKEHGVSDKDIYSNIRRLVGEDYISGNLTREQAISILKKHCKAENDAAIMAVNNWTAEKETGIKYTEITDAYLRGDIGAGEAKKMWTKYGGKTPEEAAEKIAVIDFTEKHPELDWDSSTIRKYKEAVEPQGINTKVYNDYLTGKKACKGADLDNDGKTDSGSLKAEVVELINGLPISPEQKDVLYRLNGWSERLIADTPWH